MLCSQSWCPAALSKKYFEHMGGQTSVHADRRKKCSGAVYHTCGTPEAGERSAHLAALGCAILWWKGYPGFPRGLPWVPVFSRVFDGFPCIKRSLLV